MRFHALPEVKKFSISFTSNSVSEYVYSILSCLQLAPNWLRSLKVFTPSMISSQIWIGGGS